MNLRRWGVGLSALGALALIGAGVGASYSDSGTATETQHVGTFACTLTSTDPNAVISPDGHSVTVTQGPILSSASSSFPYSNFTIHNSGTIPTFVSWNVTTSGTIVWEPVGRIGYTAGTPSNAGNTAPASVLLASGAAQTYTNVGFSWATLINADLGTSGSVSYHATCGEAPVSAISFVGSADTLVAGGTAKTASSIACPAGSPAAGYYPWVSANTAQWCGNNTFPASASLSTWPTSGSFTVLASGGTATVTYTGVQSSPYNAFTGLTNTSSATGSVTPGSSNVHQVISSTTLSLPSGWHVGDTALVINVGTGAAQAPGYTAIGGAFGNYGKSKIGYKVLGSGDGSITVPANQGASLAVAVYRGVAGIAPELGYAGDPGSVALACPALTLTNTSGSSWVIGLFGSASANVDAMTLTGMTSRSGSFVGLRDGIYDTNKGVSTWPGATGGPVATGDEWAVELLSS
ncbi:MAG: hypothetical protein WB808_13120 [Candidatus Dormiibacterota bacterium]